MIGHEDLWLFIYRERMVVYCRQCEEAKVLLLRKCLPVCLQVLLTRGLFSLTNCHQYLRKLQQHQQPQIYVVCVQYNYALQLGPIHKSFDTGSR